jgi:hypothetical protein
MYKRHAALSADPEFEPDNAYIPLPDSVVAGELSEGRSMEIDGLAYPPPFGLHANLIAGGIGLLSFLLLWILLPIVHYSGYERFRLPDNPTVTLSIAGIACSGLMFNSGLLVKQLFFLWLLPSH